MLFYFYFIILRSDFMDNKNIEEFIDNLTYAMGIEQKIKIKKELNIPLSAMELTFDLGFSPSIMYRTILKSFKKHKR